MTIPLARTVRKLKEAIGSRLPQRRDDSGLTTLEWLLIVAAVAGLAALAVVLVQNVVSDTSEQIAGNSARMTSARVQADDINQQFRRRPANRRRTRRRQCQVRGKVQAGEHLLRLDLRRRKSSTRGNMGTARYG